MLEKIKLFFKKIIIKSKKIPDQKQYIEFITALLSIPVLLTVILLNYNNLNGQKQAVKTTSIQPTPKIIYVSPDTNSSGVTAPPISPTTTITPCRAGIGNITIASPDEGETVSDNPVSIDIEYTPGDYCSVVWSYSVNGGNWSDYNNQSVSLYNLPTGNILFDLRVKSLVSSDSMVLQRKFIYASSSIVVTPTPTSQTSANATSSAH